MTLLSSTLDPRQLTVAAVITTRDRPALVLRAVHSVLAQTWPCAEIIVVIDGDDAETRNLVLGIADPRIRVLSTGAPVGGSEARNIGVRAATSCWIALLDDDDEWLPRKVERQLCAALASQAANPADTPDLHPIVSCQVLAHTAAGAIFCWPRRRRRPTEALSEYLLARNSLTYGEGLISTSMLLAPRALLLKIPFTPGLKRHQDWDWMLRAEPHAHFECVFEPLAIWYIEEPRPSISGRNHWHDSYQWIHRVQPLVTPRAYASFLLIFVSAIAAREASYAALWPILRAAARFGSPRPIDFALFAAMWCLPQRWRRSVRNRFFPRAATP